MIATSVEEAQQAGLRYVVDTSPGIRRTLRRGTFAYRYPDGRPVKDAATLDRIKKLAIPPAYQDVWICADPNGHIQATGRDARGRKQYRYHARWREARDAAKYERLLEFANALPAIRAAVERDLSATGMPKEKVLAAIVVLLETTLIRVGNEEYARDNQSFGLTTLRNRHARVKGATLRFEFVGKSGVKHRVDLNDRRLARIVSRCQDLSGQQLFEYVDDTGEVVPVGSADVNEYIRTISKADFSAKDFRTWLGTVYCVAWLSDRPGETKTERQRNAVEAVKAVAKRLRNTAAVCRSCYIHPRILERYLEAGRISTGRGARAHSELERAERNALRLLQAT